MKSKDQQLLEEAYNKITEGYRDYGKVGKLDRYGKFVPKSKAARPISDEDDSSFEDWREQEINAGLEDEEDVEPTSTQTKAPIPAPANLVVTDKQPSVDASVLSGKKFGATVWDYPDYVITVDGKPRGPMMSEREAQKLIQSLNQVSENPKAGNNPEVQKWLSSSLKMGEQI